jgi:hypothetical protein
VHRHSSSSTQPAYVSVGCTLHACSETHPCPWTLISVLRSGWFDSCDMSLHGISTPMPANLSRVPESVRACGRHLSHRCLLLSFKTASELPAKMLLVCLQKKGKKQMNGRAGTKKDGSTKHVGIGQPEDRCRPQARTLTGMQATVAWWGHWFSADVFSSSRDRY